MNKIKLLKIAPAFSVALFDMVITVTHQPEQYWQGHLKAANEGNPVAAAFMHNHVSGFFLISAIWLSVIFLLGYFLPEKASRFFLFTIFVLHCTAASGWVKYLYGGFWGYVIFTVIACAVWFIFESLVKRFEKAGEK